VASTGWLRQAGFDKLSHLVSSSGHLRPPSLSRGSRGAKGKRTSTAQATYRTALQLVLPSFFCSNVVPASLGRKLHRCDRTPRSRPTLPAIVFLCGLHPHRFDVARPVVQGSWCCQCNSFYQNILECTCSLSLA
jgi:hypothetical protein